MCLHSREGSSWSSSFLPCQHLPLKADPRSQLHCAAERFPHTLCLEDDRRVVRRGRWSFTIPPPREEGRGFHHLVLPLGDTEDRVPALCCDFTSRVARSMQTIRHPVTLGSNVPLCPVFSTRRMRRIQATTSWEEGLEGLSRLMKPVLGQNQSWPSTLYLSQCPSVLTPYKQD